MRNSNRPLPTPDRPNFYGRRGSRPLKDSRRALVDELLPKIGITYPDQADVDPNGYFAEKPEQLWLEIGFGGGEHLAGQAQANPQTGIIGAEPFMDGVGSLLRHIDERGLTNVRVIADDSRPLLYKLVDACFDRAFLLFPDPWPKKRQQKRRLVQPEFLDELYRICRPGAQIRFATDVKSYADEALARFLEHGGFDWGVNCADDWRRPPEDHLTTRYERKKLGDCAPVWLDFVRS
ncbi:tRNA (guanosine(46)-N7)-methyltransferase TrmB [Hyphomonas sp. UBA4508]|uniref:tRNA (guanosine(46)-N7)-methyltransferase TrmB n=1 Tax=Hyphomonas sp. UBA4508 TaxID=1946633 RepID=UPI0025BA7E24|nr:tRNA (guanosine(46)-N7)-methyltransferase TrmB [Hyphomonas sp. UBA4508]